MPRPELTPEETVEIARLKRIRTLMRQPWLLEVERLPEALQTVPVKAGGDRTFILRARWRVRAVDLETTGLPCRVEHRSLPTAIRNLKGLMRAWFGAMLDNGRPEPHPSAYDGIGPEEPPEDGVPSMRWHGYVTGRLLDEIEMAGGQAAAEAAKLGGLKRHITRIQDSLTRKRAALREQTQDKRELRALLQEIAPGVLARWNRCKDAQRRGALSAEFACDSLAALTRGINTLEPAGDALDAPQPVNFA